MQVRRQLAVEGDNRCYKLCLYEPMLVESEHSVTGGVVEEGVAEEGVAQASSGGVAITPWNVKAVTNK